MPGARARLFCNPHTMLPKPRGIGSSPRGGSRVMERPLRPAGRLPRPARRPLGRLRATHQGPYRAREGTTGGQSRPVDYDLTRVKQRARRGQAAQSRWAFQPNATDLGRCGYATLDSIYHFPIARIANAIGHVSPGSRVGCRVKQCEVRCRSQAQKAKLILP